MPACSGSALANVLPHRNAIPQTQGMIPHPITVYRHGADLSLCYPVNWNVILEYTAAHLSLIKPHREIIPRPSTHTPAIAQLCDAIIVVVSQKLGRKCTVPTESWARDLWFANLLRYPLTHSCFLRFFVKRT